MLKAFHLLVFIALFSIFSTYEAVAQKKIEIKYSGFLNFDEDNYPGAKILTRDDSEQVHIVHESINMWCDKAYYYGNENFLEAYGNVKMIQGDTINMTSKYVEYSGITQLAFASGDVVLKDPNSTITTDTLYFDRERQQAFYQNHGKVVKDSSGIITSRVGRYYMENKKYQFVDSVVLTNPDAKILSDYFDFYSATGHAYLFGPSTITTEESITYCEKGFYDTKAKTGYAMKNAKIDYDSKEILGDSLYFDQNRNFSSATNNIKIIDTINNSVVKGHYAEIFKAKDSIFITKRAYAITTQEKDSIYIHGDTLMVTGKPEKRITRVFRNVKLYKSDLSGKADSIHVNHESGLTQLININDPTKTDAFSVSRKPILWNIGNQMTGDTIHLQSDTVKEKMDSLIVFNHAFLISKDTLGDGYNQINGKKLIGLFNDDNEIYHIDIIKNAQSIYYFRNENNELVGIDKSKSGLINILINDNAIEEVRKINQVDGDIYPESEFPEIDKLLKGFDWREEERPSSVEDLFKDDPPLELPIIKGLEDYVPQDDFFDGTLKERLNFEGKKPKALKLASSKIKKNPNLLISRNNFKASEWEKVRVRVNSNTGVSPINTATSFTLVGTKSQNGYIYQHVPKLKGNFKLTIWLKGKGSVLIALQEHEGDTSLYRKKIVTLSKEWTKHTIQCQKDDDGHKLRVIISRINSSTNLELWNPELIEILP
ncbi:LPS export ABC transporter periplasmic protein LptC [Hyunsoonleella sp. SJ7]|uniref:LPS export ABC transporter periplasmic protein LptC n=1 Tax=Hyunsoonleella aquatilis TaxID=2762758 RepID=A0A923KMY1_9FLAO|nr:LPS export ABC transporter periplasmic protein LptC [Hyunsoonleella aquatilis]